MSEADEFAKLDALRKSGVLTQEEFDVEKAKLLAGLLPAAESISPQPDGAEAPQGEGWWQASDGKWYAADSRPGYRPSPVLSLTPPEATTPPPPTVRTQPTLSASMTAPEAEEQHRSSTLGDAQSAAEEAKRLDEILASAVLSSPATPHVQSLDRTCGTEIFRGQGMWQAASASVPQPPHEQALTVSPSAYGPQAFASSTFTDTRFVLGEAGRSRRRLRLSPLAVTILAAVFFVSTLGTGLVALKQNAVAGQWRQHDQTEVARNHVLSTRNQVLSTDLVSAHTTITALDSQTSKLNGQVKSLNTQLSAVANAKEKALDQNAVLTQLTNEAGTVANDLSTCVDDMNSLLTEIDNDLSDLYYNDPYLQSNAETAGQVCVAAQQDNEQLQSTLSESG
jgi:hypothetical protein